MKQLLTIICISILFTSCGTIKKAINKKHSTADSTSVKYSATTDVKKTDSTEKILFNSTDTKTTDSGYIKKTVVKEFYSDEFDFTGEDPAQDTAKEFDPQDRTPVRAEDYEPYKPTTQVKPVIRVKLARSGGGKLLYRETTITEAGKVQKLEERVQQVEQNGNVKTVDSSKHDEGQETQVSNTTTSIDRQVSKTKFLKGFLLALLLALVLYLIYRYYKKGTHF